MGSCKKNNDIKISEGNLIACEGSATCSYLFTESADLNENFTFKQELTGFLSLLKLMFRAVYKVHFILKHL